MNVADAIRHTLNVADMVTRAYLEDLTDSELMMRPHSQCNHIKWQLGHLIASENQMNNSVFPDAMPPLPEGFADRYSREAAASDDASRFDSKDDLFAAYAAQRAATLAILDTVSPEDLDRPSPEQMQAYAPTAGAVLNMHGQHYLMHCGQWVIVRRMLEKPVVI